ncbi:hypothetical protein SAMN05444161_3482 [Rhizobiales bacterium GAS191]|nr:hypothetical protein SAMN05519103_02648 [Rhizobiales bacterium GAS113]SED56451.1 hypothetical protein SAMN05444161_3482 [Rhizobiales bacterium GAS191]
MVGIEIGVKDQSAIAGEYLREAFQKIGIDPKLSRILNNNYENDYVVIFVGIKP